MRATKTKIVIDQVNVAVISGSENRYGWLNTQTESGSERRGAQALCPPLGSACSSHELGVEEVESSSPCEAEGVALFVSRGPPSRKPFP